MDTQNFAEFWASETHVSWLVFTSDRVYKIKKPVAFRFLDFRDRSTRVEACRREVRLNRRLSPDVYLGVGLFEDPQGVTEPVVVMKRLPAAASLSALVGKGDPGLPRQIDLIAARLAEFHQKADRGLNINALCTADALAERWRQNLAELLSVGSEFLPGDDVRYAESLALRFVAGRRRLFESNTAYQVSAEVSRPIEELLTVTIHRNLLEARELKACIDRVRDLAAHEALLCQLENDGASLLLGPILGQVGSEQISG